MRHATRADAIENDGIGPLLVHYAKESGQEPDETRPYLYFSSRFLFPIVSYSPKCITYLYFISRNQEPYGSPPVSGSRMVWFLIPKKKKIGERKKGDFLVYVRFHMCSYGKDRELNSTM